MPHRVTCRVLGVSESWFYKWRDKPTTVREIRRGQFADEIRRIFDDSGGTYGSPKIWITLVRKGWRVSVNTVAKIMAELGLAGRKIRRRRGLTRPGRRAAAPDFVHRDFTADAPDQMWCGDMTEIDTGHRSDRRTIATLRPTSYRAKSYSSDTPAGHRHAVTWPRSAVPTWGHQPVRRQAGGAGLIDQEPVPDLRVIAVGIDQGVRAMSGDEFGVTDAAGRATGCRADERCSIPGTSPRRGSRRRPARSRAGRAFPGRCACDK
ncbi:IS3 family transposase [Salinispora arenicola]|uniref:IS3 family transposase n=1 Tax=Salinispora arenicola TaxID=168697 RepID=UPI00207A3436|nr:IS3 family transposase [Salinispora arenicola]MCN0154361.1 IS3 family transposase [Salinispora arenicola]